MKINTYLAFNGQCKAAFDFYLKVLGGEIAFAMSYRESPMAENTPAELLDNIMHITLITDGNVLMGADAPPQYAVSPQGFSVSIAMEDAVEGERIFNALSEKGTVKMPFQATFWSTGFGMVIDQFGTPWMVNCQAAP